jgi:hypothetical protein
MAAPLPDASPAHPWRHNPSGWRQRIPIVGLALLGFGIATYLALYQWRVIDSVWDPYFGDQSMAVLDSEVSHQMRRWLLIPDAALGAVAYLGDAIYGIAGTTRRWQYRPWMVVLFGLDVIPLGAVGAVLVLLQAAVVGAFCTLCIASAVISLIMLVLAVDEVWAGSHYLYRVWKASGGDRKLLWNVFWGRPSALAQRVAYAPRFYAEGAR